MTGKRKRKKTITAAAAVVAAVLLSFIAAKGYAVRHTAVPEGTPEPVHLNDSLKNEMSSGLRLRGLDKRVNDYMRYWHLRGAQLAIVRNDSLLWCKGYGMADSCRNEAMGPGNIMRVASVSKLLTAAAVMKLVEEGALTLDRPAFGMNGILSDSLYTAAIGLRMADYRKITVEHLLRHQAGFRRDPVFSANDVRNQMGLDHSPEYEDYVRLVLSRPLRFCPGESQRYSNFGYMLLSEIVAKASGESYGEYVRTHVLEPAGCFDMHMAGNYYEDRRDNEAQYFVHDGEGRIVPEYSGSGKMVQRCYGGNNISLLSGAGAWTCSAAELARFVASIDGRPEVPDILSAESVRLMTEYFDENTYSLGWNDSNPAKGWSRTGTLSGTNAVIHYYPDGECWIFIANTSTWKGPGHARYTKALFDRCRSEFSKSLPAQDLFSGHAG